MSATTTDPRIDTAPGPGVVHTPQEIEDEIMKEWDGVVHFVTAPVISPRKLANCGAPLEPIGEIIEPDEVIPNECPLCAAIHEEIMGRLRV